MSKLFISPILAIGITLLLPNMVNAIALEDLGVIPVSNEFTVSPTRIEANLRQGQAQTVNISVLNSLGREASFALSVEDVEGASGEEVFALQGEIDGQYSIRNFVKVEQRVFTISHGERAHIPITLDIPAQAEGGGLYGALIVTLLDDDRQEAVVGTDVRTRIGVLLLGRLEDSVPGGELVSFGVINNEKVLSNGPVHMQVAFSNTGNVHLNPAGVVIIKDIFGRVIDEVTLERWFVLPDSVRTLVFETNRQHLLGYYSAVLELNRGYGNFTDERRVSFWVIPWILVIFLLIFTTLTFLLSRYLLRRFRLSPLGNS